MAAPGRNRPCPCGSGIKYKKCCLPRDEAARPAAPPLPRNRVVHHRGRPLLITGNSNLAPGILDHAVDHYEARDRGNGPAARMMRFVQPLIEAAGDDKANVDRALTLGMAFWNLALCEGDRRNQMLAELLETITRDEQDAAAFRLLASDMIERHRVMFPEMHRKRVAGENATCARDRDDDHPPTS